MLTKAPRGTKDILPDKVGNWLYLENLIRKLCGQYGYREIRTPIFEHTELFQRGIGETTDVVEKEMYTFTDRGNRSITLRPENTAAAVRSYLENKLYADTNLCKLFYIGSMFRYDRPQAGRYREFHQFGVEALGEENPAVDAEIIMLAMDFLQSLGLRDLKLSLNSVGFNLMRSVGPAAGGIITAIFGAATAFAAARDIPLIHTTHQQGHAAAALYAAKGEALFSQKVLLFHISGGTTDLLLCDQVRAITTLGTSTDLYAGQAVDRVGVRLGFGFPAGAEVSRLAAQCTEEIRPKSSVKGLQCSLSGLENQCNALLAAGKAPEYVCKYCLLCVADTVVRMTKAAQKEYPGLPVVCAGGVMSSDIIRTWVQQRLPQVYFVPGQYSSDNAIGVSILAAREAGLWLM